jgi:hypothetical protein
MLRKLMFAAFTCAAMCITSTAFAQGTAAEAKAMLEKAVAAVKADKANAIKSFLAGTDWFKTPRATRSAPTSTKPLPRKARSMK